MRTEKTTKATDEEINAIKKVITKNVREAIENAVNSTKKGCVSITDNHQFVMMTLMSTFFSSSAWVFGSIAGNSDIKEKDYLDVTVREFLDMLTAGYDNGRKKKKS